MVLRMVLKYQYHKITCLFISTENGLVFLLIAATGLQCRHITGKTLFYCYLCTSSLSTMSITSLASILLRNGGKVSPRRFENQSAFFP